MKRAGTLVDMLAGAARTHPERLAFTYLGDGVTEERRVTYAELDGRARAIAQRLTKDGISGERALLLYPPGLDFIEALFGCAYAGVTAVPAYPPNPARLARTLPRLLSIIGDSTPKAIVTTSAIEAIAPSVFAIAPELEAKCWIATDGIDIASGAGWSAPDITDASLILLQYTSGSTGTPKGVMLTHANLMHNQGLILESFGSDENMVGVGWLPLYHDMGLIGNVLHTLYMNAQCVLMSPMHFLQSPTAWLKAISKYRGTTAGGPNFAYEMCIRKVSAEVIDTLDLRSWRVAFNGAEPVRSDTLERFASTFGRCGFRREALLPCYGLAESSLIVSGKSRLYATCSVDERALGGGTVVHVDATVGKSVVSCGAALGDEEIAIVDAESRRKCGADSVGEIWVRSGSVSRGYWNQPTVSRETFDGRIADSNEGPFLRTGDLGFVDLKGELYVTGRLKDLIILRGRNYYPHDLERSVEEANPHSRPGCSVAFGVDIDGESRLVVVQENDPRASRSTTATGTDADPNQQALDMIRATLGEDYEIQPYAICLAKAGTIPKTSSGKVRRSECRAMYIDGTLEVVASWSMPAAVAPSKEAPRAAQEPARAGAPPNREEIEAWIIASLASKLGTAIDPEDTFASYGVDSATSVELCARLSEWLGRTVMATVVWDYPSIRELVDYLAPSTPIHAAAPPPLAAALDRVAAMTDAEVAAALAERARTQKG